MSEPDIDPVENEPVPDDGAIDLDQVFGAEDGGDDAMARGYSPPERPREPDAFGTTLAEQRRGETLDQRLAQEEPDPNLAYPDDDPYADGDLDDGQVGDARAGRLVAPDEGFGTDTEKDLVARDVGIDDGAAAAEEAAVHLVDADRRSDDPATW